MVLSDGEIMGFLKKETSAYQVKVSVLVPIYNVEKYLPECLESLQRQTLNEMEFICINDGSTDNSLEIVQRYAAQDPRFRVIDKANSGYGASMNCGLDAARGEYVGIVESDDFASANMFKTLYKYARRHECDLVKSNYFEHTEKGDEKMEPFVGLPYRRVFDPSDMKNVIRVLPIIWAALYRREMISESGIRFSETPGASFQDTAFVFKCWASARRVALLPGAYLHYRVDNASSSVKSAAKIYEVCGEYASSEAFLRADPEKDRKFSALLNGMKMDTYRWNYNRIAIEYRADFLAKWSEEFSSARDIGTLQKEYFSESDWELAQALMSDPAKFFQDHKETL